MVGKIHVVRDDVFDPETLGPLGPIARLANALHIETRERVVRDLLTIEPGDVVTRVEIREAEQVLRESGLFRTASVRPVRRGGVSPGDTVGIVVRTRDAWSTKLVASYSRAGGDDELVLGGFESNVLGSGDLLSATFRWSDTESGYSTRFSKRRFLGRQGRASVAYSEGEDNISRSLSFRQPFYSLFAPWSGAIGAGSFRGNVLLFRAGDESGRYDQDRDEVIAHYTFYRGSRARWSIGVGYALDDRRSRALGGEALAIADRLRNERRRQISLSAGRLSRSLVELRDVDRSGDPEDHALGSAYAVTAGAELRALGSTHDRAYVSLSASGSQEMWRGVFSATALRYTARFRDGEIDDAEIAADVRLLGRRWQRRTQALRILARFGRGFGPEELLYVGARTGLRGYTFRAFRGDRAFIANLEERIDPGLEILGASIGVVFFGDAGFAWERPSPVRFADVRTDVGFGLRIKGRRVTQLPFRIDFARGLGPEGAWEFTLTTGQVFGLTRLLSLPTPLPNRFGPGLD